LVRKSVDAKAQNACQDDRTKHSRSIYVVDIGDAASHVPPGHAINSYATGSGGNALKGLPDEKYQTIQPTPRQLAGFCGPVKDVNGTLRTLAEQLAGPKI
jgi:hypothetical protein